jgi:hypothetical protein
MATARQLLGSFGLFWWGFLIGENPDAFIGTLVVIGAALLLRHEQAAVIVLVPLLTLICLLLSVQRGCQRV